MQWRSGRVCLRALCLLLVSVGVFGSTSVPRDRCLANYIDNDVCSDFLKALQDQPVNNVQDVAIQNQRIFQRLNANQIKYLGDVVEAMAATGAMREIVDIVLDMFAPTQTPVEFGNFLYLSEFVMQYHAEISERLIQQRRQANDRRPFRQLKAIVQPEAARALRDEFQSVVNTFNSTKNAILQSGINVSPPFDNINTMVYHYFKHRKVPSTGAVLQPAQYLQIINNILQSVRNELNGLENGGTFRRDFNVRGYTDRFRVVVKRRFGNLVTSSGFFVG